MAARIASLGRLFRLDGGSGARRRASSVRAVVSLCLACAGLLICAGYASAGQRVFADFDGDGIRDHGAISRRDPTVVRVWLSSTHRMAIIRSREPILQLAAADVDGDARADLVTRAKSSLRVWMRKDVRFYTYRVRSRSFHRRLTPIRNHAGNADPLCAELNGTEYSLVSPSLHSTVLTMTPVRVVWFDLSHPVRGPTSGRPAFPFTPRPPPASFL